MTKRPGLFSAQPDLASSPDSLKALSASLNAGAAARQGLPDAKAEKQRLLNDGALRRQAIGMAVADIRSALTSASLWASTFGTLRNSVLNRAGSASHQIASGASKAGVPVIRTALSVLQKPAVRSNVVNAMALWRAGTTIWSIYQARKKR